MKNSCQRTKATSSLPGSIVLDKAAGKSFQVCQVCPSNKPYVYLEGQLSPNNLCMDYSKDCNCITNLITGTCTHDSNIKTNDLLNEDNTIFYPLGQYTCKQEYYEKSNKNSNTASSECTKFHLICLSQIEKYAPMYALLVKLLIKLLNHVFLAKDLLAIESCQLKKNFVQMYVCLEKKLFILLKFVKRKCPQDKFTGYNFAFCIQSYYWYYDVESQICFQDQYGCFCKGETCFYQQNSNICQKGCPSDQIGSFIGTEPQCSDKCIIQQYTYEDCVYKNCQDSCTQYQYVIPELKVCKNKSSCTKFLYGTPIL
ncbi:hypothetical protein ABPG72_007092 [Tetrahymena utriculariae]